MAGSLRADGAYVRPVLPSEFEKLSAVQARTFRRDSMMNYFGSVDALIPDNPLPSSKADKSFQAIRDFLLTLTRAVHGAGGLVMAVALPALVPGETEEERLVAFALWRPRNLQIDGIFNLLRSGILKVAIRWGLTGLKRMLFVYQPSCEHVFKNAFQKKQSDINESWHLQLLGTDPDEEGKGYCSLLMKESFARAANAPLTLEATSIKSRDIYAHWGFEIISELHFDVGKVTSQGLPPQKGEKAEGVPLWMMTKW